MESVAATVPAPLTYPVKTFAITGALVNVVAFPTLVTSPVRLAFVVTLPAVNPEAVPEMLVSTSAVGVPNAGLTSVGDVENTRLVDVVPVAPAAVYPVILLNAAIPAVVVLVPPSATVTGAVRENADPVSVSPAPAVYDPAPENCDQGNAVVPSVPPALAVQTNP